MKQQHFIKRYTIEIEVKEGTNNHDFQNKVSDLFNYRFLPILNELLDEYSSPYEVIQFDKVVIDLGYIAPHNFENEFVAACKKEFKRFLIENIRLREYRSEKQVPHKVLSLRHSKLMLLQYFLEYGRLPSSAASRKILIRDILLEILEDEPDLLLGLLKKIGYKSHVQERLIEQFDTPIIIDIFSLLAGLQISNILTHLKILQKGHQVTKWTAAKFEKTARKYTLSFLLKKHISGAVFILSEFQKSLTEIFLQNHKIDLEELIVEGDSDAKKEKKDSRVGEDKKHSEQAILEEFLIKGIVVKSSLNKEGDKKKPISPQELLLVMLKDKPNAVLQVLERLDKEDNAKSRLIQQMPNSILLEVFDLLSGVYALFVRSFIHDFIKYYKKIGTNRKDFEAIMHQIILNFLIHKKASRGAFSRADFEQYIQIETGKYFKLDKEESILVFSKKEVHKDSKEKKYKAYSEEAFLKLFLSKGVIPQWTKGKSNLPSPAHLFVQFVEDKPQALLKLLLDLKANKKVITRIVKQMPKQAVSNLKILLQKQTQSFYKEYAILLDAENNEIIKSEEEKTAKKKVKEYTEVELLISLLQRGLLPETYKKTPKELIQHFIDNKADDFMQLLAKIGRQEAVVLRLLQLLSEEARSQLLGLWLTIKDKDFVEEYVLQLAKDSEVFKTTAIELTLTIYQFIFQYLFVQVEPKSILNQEQLHEIIPQQLAEKYTLTVNEMIPVLRDVEEAIVFEETEESTTDEVLLPTFIKETTTVELVRYFLLHGNISGQGSGASALSAFYELLEKSPNVLVQLLDEIGGLDYVRQRIFTTFSISTIQQLIKHISKDQSDFIEEVLNYIQQIQQIAEMVSLSPSEFQKLLVESTIHFLLKDSKGMFLQEAFVEYLFKKLGEGRKRGTLEERYTKLLEVINRMVSKRIFPKAPSTTLNAIMKSLYFARHKVDFKVELLKDELIESTLEKDKKGVERNWILLDFFLSNNAYPWWAKGDKEPLKLLQELGKKDIKRLQKSLLKPSHQQHFINWAASISEEKNVELLSSLFPDFVGFIQTIVLAVEDWQKSYKELANVSQKWKSIWTAILGSLTNDIDLQEFIKQVLLFWMKQSAFSFPELVQQFQKIAEDKIEQKVTRFYPLQSMLYPLSSLSNIQITTEIKRAEQIELVLKRLSILEKQINEKIVDKTILDRVEEFKKLIQKRNLNNEEVKELGLLEELVKKQIIDIEIQLTKGQTFDISILNRIEELRQLASKKNLNKDELKELEVLEELVKKQTIEIGILSRIEKLIQLAKEQILDVAILNRIEELGQIASKRDLKIEELKELEAFEKLVRTKTEVKQGIDKEESKQIISILESYLLYGYLSLENQYSKKEVEGMLLKGMEEQQDAIIEILQKAIQLPIARQQLLEQVSRPIFVKVIMLLLGSEGARILRYIEQLQSILQRSFAYKALLEYISIEKVLIEGKGFLEFLINQLIKGASSNARIRDLLRLIKKLLRENRELRELVMPYIIELEFKYKIKRAKKEEAKKEDIPEIEEEIIKEEIYIQNAGLVILFPFISRYFSLVDLLKGDEFKDIDAQKRAVLLLQYILTEQNEAPEHELVLNKILTGLPIAEPIPLEIELTEKEIDISTKLLKGVLGQWKKLGSSSIRHLRGSFLLREGRLIEEESGWKLRVEQKAYDMLLDSMPWSFSMISFPWMKKVLYVEWA